MRRGAKKPSDSLKRRRHETQHEGPSPRHARRSERQSERRSRAGHQQPKMDGRRPKGNARRQSPKEGRAGRKGVREIVAHTQRLPLEPAMTKTIGAIVIVLGLCGLAWGGF